MCGIFGVVAARDAAPVMAEALARLEYRGYDSAGMATASGGVIDRRRASGKLAALRAALHAAPLAGGVGIGHTRWATHGPATEANAHPHVAGRVAVVHNGVIENHAALRAALEAAGAVFASDTDTEVAAHLAEAAAAEGLAPLEVVRRVTARLEGAFALVFLFADAPEALFCARRGSPLVLGLGEGESFIGSDAIALGPLTRRIIHLADGDIACATREGVTVWDAAGAPARRPVQIVDAASAVVGKNGHRHFMAKEIAEQPEVAARAVVAGHRAGARSETCTSGFDWRRVDRLTIIGCGTACHAGLVARTWIEDIARLPVEVEVASEYRHRRPPPAPNGAAIFVSQSGETADTLAALRQARAAGLTTLALVNVATSTMAREADHAAPIHAGPEIGVASTKAFTAQLIALAQIAISAARARGAIDGAEVLRLRAVLGRLPADLAAALACEAAIIPVAEALSAAPDVIFLGRGAMHALALEAALKLKELTYVPAQGYAAGELKHGPIALIEPSRPVVAFAPHDALFAKTLSTVHEVAARRGRVVLITDAAGAAAAGGVAWRTVVMPTVDPLAAPMIHAVAAQLIAYHAALTTGKDVDQPRNLAKSVTVE